MVYQRGYAESARVEATAPKMNQSRSLSYGDSVSGYFSGRKNRPVEFTGPYGSGVDKAGSSTSVQRRSSQGWRFQEPVSRLSCIRRVSKGGLFLVFFLVCSSSSLLLLFCQVVVIRKRGEIRGDGAVRKKQTKKGPPKRGFFEGKKVGNGSVFIVGGGEGGGEGKAGKLDFWWMVEGLWFLYGYAFRSHFLETVRGGGGSLGDTRKRGKV